MDESLIIAKIFSINKLHAPNATKRKKDVSHRQFMTLNGIIWPNPLQAGQNKVILSISTLPALDLYSLVSHNYDSAYPGTL